MEQIMKLDDINLPSHVKVSFIQKQYYSKYFCKLVLQIDKSKVSQSIYRDYGWKWNRARYQEIATLSKNLCTQIEIILKDLEFKIRRENTEVSIFFNDESVVELLVKNLKGRIIELYRPLNEAHKEVVVESRRIRVRKSLFEKCFKYKVYLVTRWELREDRYKEFKDWIDTMDNPFEERWKLNTGLYRMFNPKASVRSAGYTMAIYLNDPEDLMMCQLKFNDKIQYIEEAVLLQDL
jgi:hypothetical protein